MKAHADDLRSEIPDDALVEAISTDHKKADVDAKTRALLDHAVLATREPWTVNQQTIDGLREKGITDREVHDATQVIAYFNYINRIADGLGVDPE